jgi:A/G-specific adenine glycosylase
MGTSKHSLTKTERAFINTVWAFYKQNGRHNLPWRKTTDPYNIVVSELMLQQTQVARVIPKYREFLKRFPTARRLAAAPLREVLTEWQGLGYNRRAKFLWQSAQAVTVEHDGRWPRTFEGLRALPGIGNYTASAVLSFAHNEARALIETNVRTAYLHHFFLDKEKVPDTDLLPIVERTLDQLNAQEWNWALMDYGAYLKGVVGNANSRSSTYKKQSNFKESNRYVRGAIMRVLVAAPCTETSLCNKLPEIGKERIKLQLDALLGEGLVVLVRGRYQLP